MPATHRVVIVGASIAGLTVAEGLRNQGFDGDVVLLGDEKHLPYNRPPLSKQVLLGEWEPFHSIVKSKKELDDLAIRFWPEVNATHLDLSSRVLTTSSGGTTFDDLVIATGSRARPYWNSAGVASLHTLEDAQRLRDGLRRGSRLVVIGSGVLGSEIVSAARRLGVETWLLGRSGVLSFGAVGNGLSSRLEALHHSRGVWLDLRAKVSGIRPVRGTTEVTLQTGKILSADFVIAAIGTTPNTGWLAGSTLAIEDGVVCDSSGRASDGIWAAGDVAAWVDPFTGRARRIEHQTNAVEQGLAVATGILRGVAPAAPVPFFWSEIHGVHLKAYGWFDDELLSPVDGWSIAGELLTARTAHRTTGVVSWNLPTRSFRHSRALVEAPIPLVERQTI